MFDGGIIPPDNQYPPTPVSTGKTFKRRRGEEGPPGPARGETREGTGEGVHKKFKARGTPFGETKNPKDGKPYFK
jgi:hypothetical protein